MLQFFAVLEPRGKGTLFKRAESEAHSEMKGEHGCRRTFKTPFLIPDYFLHAVSQAHEHLWPRVTDPHLGVKTTLLILHSPERGVGAGTIISLSES